MSVCRSLKLLLVSSCKDRGLPRLPGRGSRGLRRVPAPFSEREWFRAFGCLGREGLPLPSSLSAGRGEKSARFRHPSNLWTFGALDETPGRFRLLPDPPIRVGVSHPPWSQPPLRVPSLKAVFLRGPRCIKGIISRFSIPKGLVLFALR